MTINKCSKQYQLLLDEISSFASFFCVLLFASSFYHFLCLAFLSVDIFTISSIVKFQVPSLHLFFSMSTCQRFQSLFPPSSSAFRCSLRTRNNKERAQRFAAVVHSIVLMMIFVCTTWWWICKWTMKQRNQTKKLSTKNWKFFLSYSHSFGWDFFFSVQYRRLDIDGLIKFDQRAFKEACRCFISPIVSRQMSSSETWIHINGLTERWMRTRNFFCAFVYSAKLKNARQREREMKYRKKVA